MSALPHADTGPVLPEIIPHADKLILAFGGIKGALGMPTFEFYQSANILQESKVFFRDLSQGWYHTGLRGLTTDIPQTCDYIRQKIIEAAPREVLFIGNSMGGYAAILFSTLLDTGKVISFSPQTFISPSLRMQAGDRRWQRQVLLTYLKSAFKPKYFDLQSLMQRSPRSNRITIYCSSLEPLDLVHAQRLSGFANVDLRVYDIGGHRLVKHLRDAGELGRILAGQAEVSEPTSEVPASCADSS